MNHLGLFAKYWQPGSVKTRLGASIGLNTACEIYHSFLFNLLTRHAASGDSRSVVFAPPESLSKFKDSIPECWTLRPQTDGDLGQRMESFFQTQFAESGVSKIVIIGADCPLLDIDVIESSFESLDNHDVVIGPSKDGGYYLLGMREKCHDIFSNIEWSTPNVLPDTIKHLERQKIEYQLLDPLNDIDDIGDLMELKQQLIDSESSLNTLEQNLLQQINSAIENQTEDPNSNSATEPEK